MIAAAFPKEQSRHFVNEFDKMSAEVLRDTIDAALVLGQAQAQGRPSY